MKKRFPIVDSLGSVLVRRRDRAALALIAITSSVGSACEVLTIMCISTASLRLVGNISDNPGFPLGFSVGDWTVLDLVIAGVLLILGRLIAMTLNAYTAARLSSGVLSRFRTRLAGAFFGATWREQTQQDQASIQVLMASNISNVTALVLAVGNTFTSLFGFVTFVVSAFILSPGFALGLAVFGGLLFSALRPINRRIRRMSRVQQDENREFARVLEEGISVSLELRVFGVEESLMTKLSGLLRQFVRARTTQVTMSGLNPQIYQSVGLLMILIGLAVVSKYDFGNLGVVGALVLLMIRGLNYGQAFQSNYTNAIASVPYVAGLMEELERLESEPPPTGTTVPQSGATLDIIDLSCGYGSVSVLREVNITIVPGQAIGIVGPSGAGKSTLAALLMGLVGPQDGRFTIGGVDWFDVDRRWWTSNISFVPQEPKLIAGTVEDNIRFMRADVTESQILRAAHAAHLSGELASWEDGIRHEVGPRGSRLSGGQKQRVCIARALATNPQVLVLDEPTSALDSSAEESISGVLQELRGSTTLVIIAHRLSTIAMCDVILKVEGGRVVKVDDPRSLAGSPDLLED